MLLGQVLRRSIHTERVRELVSQSLSAKKGRQLKEIMSHSGLATSGRKSELITRLQNHYDNIISNGDIQGQYVRQRALPSSVLSFDLGYRNLAFCHLDSNNTIRNWIRADLELPSFHPSITAPLVRQFIQTKIGPWIDKVGAVVVEQQRYRSGGAHSVLESTIRVNAIEAMIWYGLEEVRTANIIVMEPIQRGAVDKAWDEALEGLTDDSLRRYYGKKKACVGLVNGLIDKQDIHCPDEILNSFRQEKKQDDLGDSLLQAMTWYKWRRFALDQIDMVIE
ncbi:ribonuclease H-like domain-containing protein [Phycomyces nitens]|nr:ribonuclease H-like domain-containing protein [Phycomyces nitens]